jgi:prefoldin subunit 5
MTVVDRIKEEIELDRRFIDQKKEELRKIDMDIRYYRGHIDGLQTALEKIKSEYDKVNNVPSV